MSLVFNCTGACRIRGRQSFLPPTPVQSHWAAQSGTLPTINTGPGAGPSGFGLLWTLAATSGYVQKDKAGTGLEQMGHFKIMFPDALPDASTSIWRINLAVGSAVEIRFTKTTNSLQVVIGANSSGGFPVVADTMYTVDFKYVQTGGVTSTVTWRVNGVDQGVLAITQASVQPITTYRIGSISAVTGKIAISEIVVGDAGSDYPLISTAVQIGIVPTADGVHPINASGDVKYNNLTNVAPGATDVFSYLNNRLEIIEEFISFNNVSAGEGVRVRLGGMPAATQVLAMELILGIHSVGANANKVSAKLHDAGQASTMFADADFSETTIGNRSVHFNTRISTLGALTQAAINAMEVEVVSSYTAPDVADIPLLDGIVAEVLYIPSVVIPPDVDPDPPGTISKTLTIPNGVALGDGLIVAVMSKGHTAGTPHVTVTDNEFPANPWTRFGETPDRRGTLWKKRATAQTAGKVISVALGKTALAAGVAVWKNVPADVPVSNIQVYDPNAALNVPTYTPSKTDSEVVVAIFSNGSLPVSAPTMATLGALSIRFQNISNDGSGCAVCLASKPQDFGPNATGTISWTQSTPDNQVIVFGLEPILGGGVSWTNTTLVDSTGTQGSEERLLFGTTLGQVYTIDPSFLEVDGYWLSKQHGKEGEQVTIDRVRVVASATADARVGVSFTTDGGITYSDEVMVLITPSLRGVFSGSNFNITTAHLFQVRIRPLEGECIVHEVNFELQPRGRVG